MACSSFNNLNLSHKIRYSLASSLFISKSSHALPSTFTTPFPSPSHTPIKFNKSVKFSTRSVSVSLSNTYTFTWDDVVRISQPDSVPHDSSDLSGFFQKVKICNRGSEKQSEFLPFVIEDQIAGYIHNGFANHLRRFKDVFIFPQDSSYGGRIGSHVTLHPMLRTPDDRTNAVGDVVKFLGEELIPGIRNELYPVTSSFGAPIFFSLERAAAPYFGIKAYGVHMNGYVDKDGQKLLWIGKRSQMKATYPGMLDHLAAGGLPYGIACGENLVKECEEEAGIPKSISKEAIPVGVVSYMDIDGYRYKRDVLFCYDLKLPASFRPENQDGEVDSFKLIPVTHVANVIQRTQFFKPNCSLVIIDFLFRHGYMSPEHFGYLDLLQSLRSGDCS
nr:nudix hydrolase 20, chloroplastic-like [Quercus suber]POF25545.1 nudix hydrolase 20, chloroplastic [Quercus suber]